jgi:ATP-binding cassette subfamily F protein uup
MTNIVEVTGLTKLYGEVVLFEDINFSLIKGSKTALVAKNGEGKTTMLNVIAGKEPADKGKVNILSGTDLSYLEQQPHLNDELTVFQQAYQSQNNMLKVIAKYEKAIASGNQGEMQDAMDKMDSIGAWDFEVKVKQILSIFGINDMDKPVKYLSGGQRKRLALANTLINEPDFLVLDEPTNHLDIDMIEWLEDYLYSFTGTVFLVTHDRYFLDNVCDHIIELEKGNIYTYKGNYSYYLEKKEERHAVESSSVEKAKNLLKKELDWMRRMPKARGTKAKYRVNAFDELKERATAKATGGKIDINVQTTRMGKKILEVKDLGKSFGHHTLLKDFSYTFSRYEKVGIIGRNGTGKSTLLNLLTGNLSPDMGEVEPGETISFGYYRQEGLVADEQKKVIDVITDIAEVVTLGDGSKLSASQFLNYFLFPPAMQHAYVYKLSGGEKRRLYLLTVLMQNPNFLILDEPTNDLDIITLNVLEEYLSSFKGCVIIVSHDRFFMDKIVDHVFVLNRHGQVKDIPGNYSQYREAIKEIMDEKPTVVARKEKPKIATKPNKTKPSYKEKREFALLEKEIADLEAEKNIIEEELSSGKLDQEKLLEKSNRVAELISLLDVKEDRWLELSEIVN